MWVLIPLFIFFATPAFATITVCNQYSTKQDQACAQQSDCPDADANDGGTGDCETVPGETRLICNYWSTNQGKACTQQSDCTDRDGTDGVVANCGVYVRTTGTLNLPMFGYLHPGAGSQSWVVEDRAFKEGISNAAPAANALGNLTGSANVDWSDGNFQEGTLTGSVTLTFSNPVVGQSHVLALTQDGTGGRLVTWPTATWVTDGVAKQPELTASRKTLFRFEWNGTSYTAARIQSVPRMRLAAAADPIATDDLDSDYQIGSLWINTTASPRRAFVATDVSDDAAVWLQIPVDTDNQSLNDAANVGRVILGANSESNAVVICVDKSDPADGDCADAEDAGWKFWDDTLNGPTIKAFPDGHITQTIPSGFDYVIRSTTAQLESLSDAGVHTVSNGAKYQSKIGWGAGALSIDGTNCATANRVEETLNSGPKKWTIRCADNGSSVIYGSTPGPMPKGWDEGTVQMCVSVWHGTTETITLAGDFQCQCHDAGEVVDNSWSSVDANSAADVAITTANRYERACSAAITCAGTCDGEDIIDWKYTIDAANTSANAANTRIVSTQLIYTRSSRDDF